MFKLFELALAVVGAAYIIVYGLKGVAGMVVDAYHAAAAFMNHYVHGAPKAK